MLAPLTVLALPLLPTDHSAQGLEHEVLLPYPSLQRPATWDNKHILNLSSSGFKNLFYQIDMPQQYFSEF